MAPKAKEAAAEVAEPEVKDVDRVTSISMRADGTPDQSEGFEVIEA